MSSRRLLTVALVALVTLLAAPRGAEAARRYNPDCTGRRDDARCGPCQTCLDEVCVRICDRCEDCHNGKCVPRPEGSLCLGDCGTCQGGVCLPDRQVCFDRDPCKVCSNNFTCVVGNEGNLCKWECGICRSGVCTPDAEGCADRRCQRCDESFTCRADSEFLPCKGDCGICVSGACSPDEHSCPRCQGCDVDTLNCVPKLEGEYCEGDCGTCQNGQCLANGERCPACTLCRGSDLACTPFPSDSRCAGECCGGTCVPTGGLSPLTLGAEAAPGVPGDPNNCGGCGIVCGPGQGCCEFLTPVSTHACMDTQGDPNNCGTCGNVCSSGQCCQGSCAAECPGGQVRNVQTCECECPPGTTSCGGICKMTESCSPCHEAICNEATGELECREKTKPVVCPTACDYVRCNDQNEWYCQVGCEFPQPTCLVCPICQTRDVPCTGDIVDNPFCVPLPASCHGEAACDPDFIWVGLPDLCEPCGRCDRISDSCEWYSVCSDPVGLPECKPARCDQRE